MASVTQQSNKKPAVIKSLNEVGRYAVGVQWSDGHDSIFPLENLRRFCPCVECSSRHDIDASGVRLKQFTRLGEHGVLVGWTDGHETLYTLGQLRSICRCAYCVGEPQKPITGA
jgi:DUF971 family protein